MANDKLSSDEMKARFESLSSGLSPVKSKDSQELKQPISVGKTFDNLTVSVSGTSQVNKNMKSPHINKILELAKGKMDSRSFARFDLSLREYFKSLE